MKTVHKFTVVPTLPDNLSRLRDIAMNLWWSWDTEALKLFFRLGREIWEKTYQNPIRTLGEVSQARLEHLSNEETFLAHLERVVGRLDEYMGATTWYQSNCGGNPDTKIAYFSAEYGITDALPIYSGGLGILAGDHLKAASDLGIPLVGVGLLYRQGYFRQYLNADGWQLQRYPENDFYNMPVELLLNDDGSPMMITVDVPHPVQARLWKAQVGRIQLYLLDTNVDSNSPADRDITAQLYGGDSEMRIRQEILLGIGGHKMLRALGIEPTVCHANEGHAAFLTIERARCFCEEKGLNVKEALEAVKAGTVFTTHTPVPAGHDVFSTDLMKKYVSAHVQKIGMNMDEFLKLGRLDDEEENVGFNMTLLAMRLSSMVNGVSKLHGEVSRQMMEDAYPGYPTNEVPIGSITNGIHTRSWISFDLADLYDRYLGPRWVTEPGDHTIWDRVDEIPNTELWRTHARRRERLVVFARDRLSSQLSSRGMPASDVEVAMEVLDPEALTIGFARRFATYKRGTLLFKDPERLGRILKNSHRPLQIIFAGKAHPADNAGKEYIRQIIHHCRQEPFRHHIVFLEDYDMNVARYMLQGVDVWLNNPRRPMEASGTSGMKAAANGALNFSIPDGWWPEGYDGENGWNIGRGEDYDDLEYQDRVESQAIYDLLEDDIIPMFYDRGADGVPREWVRRMKHNMRTLCPVFNTSRMVQEYTETTYLPTAARFVDLSKDGSKRAKDLSQWKQRVAQHWGGIKVGEVTWSIENEISVGQPFEITAKVHLGDKIQPDDVAVEVYYGTTDPHGKLPSGQAVRMAQVEGIGNGDHRFVGKVMPQQTGRHGFSIRVVPNHPDLVTCAELPLITWS